jgi:pimeloyl-ACP methyl ester carboxylesterase
MPPEGANEQRLCTPSGAADATVGELFKGDNMRKIGLIVALLASFAFGGPAIAETQWMTLPPTPTLPDTAESGYAPVNGVKIWYAVFGQGQPVILLHGGLGNSSYWGNQVPELAKHYKVIVMDSRGHGRSTRNEEPYGYDLMASDVVALLDYLKIDKTALVGWSDGAILGLDIAIHHPERLSKLFAFAANSDTSGVADISKSDVFNAYIDRASKEYEVLSATPAEFGTFVDQISKMWATQPNWTADDLKKITVPTWIVDGDRDEAIKRENTEFMAANVPDAGLLILPNVSHFAFLQDSKQFTDAVLHFMEAVPGH